MGSEEEVINGCGVCQGTVPAPAPSSAGSPAAGPGDPSASSVYPKSPDLSIVKGKYHLGEGQGFIF